jgi:hypothetical protein
LILAIDTLQEWRDVIMIAFMSVGLFAFFAIFLVTVISGYFGIRIMSRVKTIVVDDIQPTAENVRATAENIRGSVEYVTETAVKPVAKVYGAAAGAKRFVNVVARFTARDKPSGG